MKRLTRVLIGFAILSLLLVLAALLWPRPAGVPARAGFAALANDAAGFARAEGPRAFDFPADHGPHPDYQTEWWYYTGNLGTADGRHFGYQLTFFRRALTPPTERQDRPSNWAADQIYMAHFSVTDVAGGRYRAYERFSRGAAGLAGAVSPPYRVWQEDWSAEEIAPGVVRVRAAQGDQSIELVLTDRQGPVLQGDSGYSQKGPDPGNASYYVSQTRLETVGTVQVGDAAYPVTGLSWMDHEFSTSALAPDQVGWDWFALQLDNGSELMVYQVRRADGQVDPFSSGTFITADGRTRRLARDEFSIAVGGTWRSPRSGATYPARWTVTVPALDLTLDVEPYLADQELNVSYAYWEGAVRLRGQRAGAVVNGSGYVELTGYAGSMQGQF
ncbi:MAG: carotenoid 1,2-hydratase [Chloroflexi bacterium]|nr:carotenoid 1,2-hydratase [Chloroflexota bacterium]MBU1750093.1 carotenoid 1,2-hydratase [Chloroflexota bacterium]